MIKCKLYQKGKHNKFTDVLLDFFPTSICINFREKSFRIFDHEVVSFTTLKKSIHIEIKNVRQNLNIIIIPCKKNNIALISGELEKYCKNKIIHVQNPILNNI